MFKLTVSLFLARPLATRQKIAFPKNCLVMFSLMGMDLEINFHRSFALMNGADLQIVDDKQFIMMIKARTYKSQTETLATMPMNTCDGCVTGKFPVNTIQTPETEY